MVKTPIKVVVRSRPTANFAHKNIKIDDITGQINVNIPKHAEQGYVNHQQENWGFQFDKVLQNSPQEAVFDVCAKDIIGSVLEGYSGTILCYGQTGAGKTFSMTGSTTDYKYRGLVPRCISLLFQEIQSRYDQKITVGVSYLEDYNEQLTDLLQTSLEPNSQPSQLAIQEDQHGRINVKGQLIKICETEEEAQSMIFEGETNRTICSHKLNKNSTRSHCIFTIHLEIRSRVESSEKVIISKLNLVDLAGSERTKKTGSSGQTLLEAQFINKSLSFLEQVVVALSEKGRDHIPYRQCKLTNLLKDSIGGNSKTMMIANIWPEADHLEETISTLKFASRMMKVSNETTVQLKLDPTVLLKKYEREIKDLKQELAMHDTLSNRGRIQYDQYTPEQQYKVQQQAMEFLKSDEDIEFESLRQVKELFFQFRNIYKSLMKDIENKNYVDVNQQGEKVIDKKQSQLKDEKSKDQVGTEDNKTGFGLGQARKDAKPLQKTENLVNIPKDQFKEEAPQQENSNEEGSPVKTKFDSKKIVNVDRKQVYVDYLDREGKEYNTNVVESINTLKEKKVEIKLLTAQCQEIKQQIDSLKANLDKKQENKNQEEILQGIIDEEEYEIIKELKELKRTYKEYSQNVKDLKRNIIFTDQSIQQQKQGLLQKFEEFFQKKYGITLQDIDNPLINQPSEMAVSEGQQSEDIDSEALAYIRAKKKVGQLQKARKQEKQK